jgi:GNAT superfamily N-acetyltransferase
MADGLNNLYRLTKDDVKPAAELLARAFHDYSLSAYFIPDDFTRRKKQVFMFQSLVRQGISHGEVYATSAKLEGVAVWFSSDTRRRTFWSKILSGFILFPLFLGPGTVSRQKAFGEYAASVRKRCAPFPHWYLQLLGVDPAHQGKGYASVLLKPMFDRLSKEGQPCFLETQGEKNVALYEHLGFRVAEMGTVPGSDVKSWAMLRDSKGDKGRD